MSPVSASAAARLLLVVLALPATFTQAADIAVEALMRDLAVLSIDGRRVTLRAGESRNGVTLLAADARSARVRIGDREQTLTVSQRISTEFRQPEQRVVTVRRNEQLQFRTTAEINGVRMPVIVDTGANIIALNAAQASAVGITADEGLQSEVQTAGSVVPARQVTLDSVAVGGIRVDAVLATVIDGPQPATALLGMTFLKHVEMEERDGILVLKGRW